MARTKKKFVLKGVHISQEKAERYGLELIRLREEANGSLKTEEIVKEAREEDSPLHDFFQWDDSIAGELYRRSQARKLTAGIYEVIIEGEEEKLIPLFYNVIIETRKKDEMQTEQGYVFNVEIVENKDYYEQQLEKAVREIKHWQEKYSMLKELSEIFGVIKKIQKKLDFEEAKVVHADVK